MVTRCPVCDGNWKNEVNEVTLEIGCDECLNGTITVFEDKDDYKKRLKKSALKKERGNSKDDR
jgi:reverse gyrase